MALLMLGVFAGDKHQRAAVSWLAIALLVVAGVVRRDGAGAATAFNGAFVVDDFARFAKVLMLGGAALVLSCGAELLRREQARRASSCRCWCCSPTLGMMLMVSAANFLTLYMGLELQSLALYVLAAFDRDNLRSTEAGLKYFVLGALSSGMMLYGISLIYGFTGTHRFRRHRRGRSARAALAIGRDLRPRVPDRGPRLQGLRRAVPHVDARRL